MSDQVKNRFERKITLNPTFIRERKNNNLKKSSLNVHQKHYVGWHKLYPPIPWTFREDFLISKYFKP